MARRKARTTGFNPLPSFLRASAQDAGNMQMRTAGRTRWNDDDWNRACDEQERLTRACYGKPGDNDDRLCFIRFGIAEQWERQGLIGISSDWESVLAAIGDALNTPISEAE